MFKKILPLFISISILLVAGGCGSGKKSAQDIPGMIVLNLKNYGAPIAISIPDTTKAKLEISTQSSGAIEIKSGKDFQIRISTGETDFALKKNDVAQDDVKKLKKYLVDEPATLLWESQIPGLESEFHFLLSTKVGKDAYYVEDISDAETFSEKSIRQMIESAKSIRGPEGL